MEIINNFTNSIHIELKRLIELKSKRDQIKFTSSQLANALQMPRSIITKLTHPDSLKRVTNPRIDTLLKIVDFFRADGFNVTIDGLLGLDTKSINVQDQELPPKNMRQIILFSFDSDLNKILGEIRIKTHSKAPNIIALLADHDIRPIFKKGSIFIIDREAHPTHDTLVAIKLSSSKRFTIKKYWVNGTKQILKSLDSNESSIAITSNFQHEILGTVIQINAKT